MKFTSSHPYEYHDIMTISYHLGTYVFTYSADLMLSSFYHSISYDNIDY